MPRSVFEYTISTCTLSLTSAFPVQTHSQIVAVDAELILGNLEADTSLRRPGANVTIIGNVQAPPTRPRDRRGETPDQRDVRKAGAHVQALCIWSAQETAVQDYSDALDARRNAMRAMRQAREQVHVQEQQLKQ